MWDQLILKRLTSPRLLLGARRSVASLYDGYGRLRVVGREEKGSGWSVEER